MVVYIIVVTHALLVWLIGLGLPRYNDLLARWRHCLTMILDLAFEVLGTHSRVYEMMFFTKKFTVILIIFLPWCFCGQRKIIHSNTI